MQRNFSVNMTTTPTIRGDAKAPELNEETGQAAMELFVLWSINSSRNSHFQIWLSGATVARLIPACGMQRFLSGVSRRLSVRIGSRSFFFIFMISPFRPPRPQHISIVLSFKVSV